ncbi:MAG: hypothetical protein IIU04_08635, partial [Bacteroidales bacterium]|nr:hypothetical protein [Bacteroidales bacterium]
MIDAYYSVGCNSKELFTPYEIATKSDFEKHLNKYNVIHLDVSSFADFYKENLVEKILEYLYDEFQEEYKENVDYTKSISVVLMQIYRLSKR